VIRESNDRGRIRRNSIRHQEIQQTPEFHQVILQGCTSQQQSPARFETKQGLPSLRPEVLDIVRFVQDHVNPAFPSENVLVGQNNLVRCDAHLPGVFGMPAFTLLLALFLITIVGKNLQSGKKLFELHFPVEDDRSGDDNQVLAPNTFIAREMTKKRDSLDRFTTVSSSSSGRLDSSPETHLVGEDTVHLVRVQAGKPFQPCLLIRSERTP
jgi:hypothetical protein